MSSRDYIQTRQQISVRHARLSQLNEVPKLGDCLLNRFKIFGIRSGGFGIVYLVIDLNAGDRYAFKTYKYADGFDESIHPSFALEIDAWINMEQHPHIVQAHSVKVDHGRLYLVLEYVEGPSLRKLMSSKPLQKDLVMTIIYQICLGMEFANKKGEFSHSDLKPENVLMDRGTVAKITDFGLARKIHLIGEQYPRVNEGSWPYAPPERFTGKAEDSRSDIFSIGVILYELLTGRLPYQLDLSQDPNCCFAQLAEFHRKNKISSNWWEHSDALTPELSDLLWGCLSLHPGERFRNFTSLRCALERFHSYRLEPGLTKIQTPPERVLEQALAMAAVGKASKALGIFNHLLKENPGEAAYWLNAGIVLLIFEEFEQAQKFLHRAFTLAPSLPGKALQYFIGMLNKSPEESKSWYGVGLVLVMVGENEKAQKYLCRAVALEPSLTKEISKIQSRIHDQTEGK